MKHTSWGAIRSSVALALYCGGCSANAEFAHGEPESRSIPTPFSDADSNTMTSEIATLGEHAQPLTSLVYGTVTYLGDIPSNKTTDGWFNNAQGVAIAPIGGTINMFYSENSQIRGREAQSSGQFGVSLNFPPGTWHATLPSIPGGNFDHFGDLDFVENAVGTTDLLYVPIEEQGQDIPPQLVVYEVIVPNILILRATVSMPQNTVTAAPGRFQAPWVSAWTPNPSYILSSEFNATETVMYHDEDPSVGVSFDSVVKVALATASFQAMLLTHIQGGEFNKDGRLFLLAEDGPGSGARPGVYAFVFATSPVDSVFAGAMVLKQFDFYPATLTPGRNEEFEGITVGTIDPPGANDLSDIHAVLNQDGDIFFKHWVVSENRSHFAP